MNSISREIASDFTLCSTSPRTNARNASEMKRKPTPRELSPMKLFDVQVTPIFEKKITVQSLISYARQLVAQIYESDPLGIGRMMDSFLAKDLQPLRYLIQQRLFLLQYLNESLKFKSYAEIQCSVLKQWRKNLVFFSVNTIWAAKMSAHGFRTMQEFTDEYKKQITLIANLTHFYFKDALVLLDGQNDASFSNIQQDTSHKILNALRDWGKLYKGVFLPLVRARHSPMDMQFDPRTLSINPQYLDTQSGKAQLVRTIEKIRRLAAETTIHSKIQLLRQVRSTLIQQIQQNRDQIAKKTNRFRFSGLQKDDIIGCMIYCIISGQITQIGDSIHALTELLGPDNDLLSRRGVDSYRADLQSAVEYLCQQMEPNCKSLEGEESKIDITKESTQLSMMDQR